jgi:hypothetical protein
MNMNIIEQIEALYNKHYQGCESVNEVLNEVISIIDADPIISAIDSYEKSGNYKDLIPLADYLNSIPEYCVCGFEIAEDIPDIMPDSNELINTSELLEAGVLMVK